MCVVKVARGFTACLKTYPDNLTVTSIGFKNSFPKIFLNSSADSVFKRISKVPMLINTLDSMLMKYIATCTFWPIAVLENYANIYKKNQTNFMILIIYTKKIIWNLYLKEK